MIIIVIVLLFVSKCKCSNYCGVNICNNSRLHTLCKYRSNGPARHCSDYENIIKTDFDTRALLEKINSRRNKVAAGEIRSLPPAANMLKLEWNTELEKSARRWADQCVKHSVSDLQDSCRDLEGISVGQNIATIVGEAPGLTAISLVDVWYMELLNMNAAILSKYEPSFFQRHSHYDYFTQLVWADSKEVGCGGVKFKERYEDDVGLRNRTIYRLVCNFAPGGNRWNNSVYINGLPCSRCPHNTTCDVIHKSLCKIKHLSGIGIQEEKIGSTDLLINQTSTPIIGTLFESVMENSTDHNITINDDNYEEYAFTLFNFMSDFHGFTRQTIEETSTKSSKCNKSLEIDDFLELLKRKLSNDPMFRELLMTKSGQNHVGGEVTFTDPGVEAFVSKIYSKKEIPTTTKATDNDFVNSTLLVDLVEAVIFKSGGHLPSELVQNTTQIQSDVTPVKIQAELAETKTNYDFTGHYFFPEDDEDSTTETSESYYDVSSGLLVEDVVLEMEDIKKSSFTKDFLEEIIDLDSAVETTSTQNMLSPDDMTIYKSGHSVMKKFLKHIEDNSRKVKTVN